MARALYTLLLHLALPLILLRLAWRARRQREYLRHVGERFGRPPRVPPGPLIWLHAVSLGETRAARPLVEALLADYPGHRLLITHMTPTGRAASTELFGDRVVRAYLPYDYPWAAGRFLRALRPALGLLMETELWPNLLRSARRQGIPVLLLNARLSERSARRYARFRRLAGAAFGDLACAAAQTDEDAARLRAAGVPRVQTLGNLKFDVVPPEAQLRAGRALREAVGARRVLLCASTREGEEALILDAPALPENALLVIVPRHPQRFDEVERLLRARGLSPVRRSAGTPDADARVLLGDTMGEMYAYYAAADVAFVGGSLLPLGGQNLIEACAVGVPVIVGPHTFNFQEATEQAVRCGAALRAADAGEMMALASALLADPGRRVAMGEAGRAFAARHRGATERSVALVAEYLPTSAAGR